MQCSTTEPQEHYETGIEVGEKGEGGGGIQKGLWPGTRTRDARAQRHYVIIMMT